MCFPAGARVGSTTHGWATSTKGCSACRPAWTAASDRATSSNVPPTWTVTVRRQASALQGTGPSSAQSTLHVPAPGLKRAHGRPARREQLCPGQRDERTRRGVEEHGARRRQLGQRRDRAVGVHHATQAAQFVGQTLGDGRAAPRHHGPAGAVAERGEEEAEGRGQRGRQRLHRMRRRAGQQGARRIRREAASRVLHGRRPDECEAGERQRVARHAAHRRQDVGHDAVQPVHQRTHQVLVGRRVTTEVRRRLADVAVQRGRAGAAERVGEGDLGLAQSDAEAGQVERAEEG